MDGFLERQDLGFRFVGRGAQARGMHSVVTAVLLCAIATARAADPDSDVLVTARLVALERAPDCGIVAFGSPATYKVIAGPPRLVDRDVFVLVACVELARGNSPSNLKAFELGATHHLALTKQNIFSIESPSRLPAHGDWYYLRRGSLAPMHAESSREGASSPEAPSSNVKSRDTRYNE